MLLIEVDGKGLFAGHGIDVPRGILATTSELPALPTHGPWIVKAQMPAGGRGKAGGTEEDGSVDARVGSQMLLRRPFDRFFGRRKVECYASLRMD